MGRAVQRGLALAILAGILAGAEGQAVGRPGPAPEGYFASPLAGMSRYVVPSLNLYLSYPGGFTQRTPQALEDVLAQDHLRPRGSGEGDAPAARAVLRCMRTILTATSGVAASRTAEGESAPDTLVVADVDRGCVGGDLHGDHALDVLVSTVLRMRALSPMVTPHVVYAAGRRIHTGMSTGMIIVNDPAPQGGTDFSGRQTPVYLVAASFEQEQHWVLVTYISGTAGEANRAVGRMSLAIGGAEPVLLFPFLAGRTGGGS